MFLNFAEDDTAVSSAAAEPEEGKTAESTPAEAKKTEDGPKPNYVPQSRLNEMAAQKRDAEAERDELQEKLDELQAESARQTPVDTDPATKDAKDLITETVSPLIEREFSKLQKQLAKAEKKLAATEKAAAASSQEVQWNQTCDKLGADPTNKEFTAVVYGLSKLDLTMEDAVKRALQMVPGAAKTTTGSGKGASVETSGFDGVPSTSDWVPKSNAEAVKGGLAGKRAKQLSTSEILAARKEKQA